MATHPVETQATNDHWWLPALLSLFWPGVGQLYNGRWRSALLFVAGVPLLTVLSSGLAVTLPVPFLNALPLLFAPSLRLAAIVDAARDERIGEATGVRPLHSRRYFCVALVLLYAFVLEPAWVGVMRTLWVQGYSIPTGSMETAILRGDRVLVCKYTFGLRNPVSGTLALRFREPRRGELVAYLFPRDRQRTYLHRVIGLPGEKVEIRDKQVFVDSTPLDEPYAHFVESQKGRGTWGPTLVPPGQLLVLGDNRDNSRDGRYWGFVPIDDVLGQARMVYFSAEYEVDTSPQPFWRGVRWSRLGTILR